MPVNAPLVFDIYDRWTGRAIGGCTYHVGASGRPQLRDFPVNANEAEARRLARFQAHDYARHLSPTPAREASRRTNSR